MDVSRAPQKFSCTECAHRHCDETGEIEGSAGRSPIPRWKVDGIPVHVCPLPTVTGFSREMLRWHVHYRNRLLPLAGGVLDQPAAFLRAMEIIESASGSGACDR